jgi:hypothetical protein
MRHMQKISRIDEDLELAVVKLTNYPIKQWSFLKTERFK